MDFVVFLDPFVDEVQRRLGVSAFGGVCDADVVPLQAFDESL